MITIDQVQEIVQEICDELPEPFFKELNGGIILLPQAALSPQAKYEDLYTMGEYVIDRSMGRYIAIYYGSFEKLFGNCSRDLIARELRETVLHEFTHHMESLAGERGLEIKDNIHMARYLIETEQGYVSSPQTKGFQMRQR